MIVNVSIIGIFTPHGVQGDREEKVKWSWMASQKKITAEHWTLPHFFAFLETWKHRLEGNHLRFPSVWQLSSQWQLFSIWSQEKCPRVLQDCHFWVSTWNADSVSTQPKIANPLLRLFLLLLLDISYIWLSNALEIACSHDTEPATNC